MFDFYLTIIDSIAKSQDQSFVAKFNNMVYAEAKLSSDEKFYLLGELQKRVQKYALKREKSQKFA
jgi:hypothetical protein